MSASITELELKKVELMAKLHAAEAACKESSTTTEESKESSKANEENHAELVKLIKEKETVEAELSKMKEKHQLLYEEKVQWLSEKVSQSD